VDFSPSVYEHCARLLGRRPWEVSRDAELLFAGQAEAYRLYRHRPVVVGVDIYNLEAEAYGAVVGQPDGDGIPAVTGHCCESLEAMAGLPAFDPSLAGRIPLVLEVGRRLRQRFPEADVRIPVAGPFSIAANVLGFETLLCEAYLRPLETRQALLQVVAGQMEFCRAIVAAGLGVAFFESAAAPPLLSPALFRQVELPALKAAIEGASAVTGTRVPCVMGGDTTPILPDLLATGTGYVICPAPNETDQAAFLHIMAAHPEVMVRVNMRPDIVAAGEWERVRAEVDRIAGLVRGRRRVCLGTGALPYETDPETVLRIREYAEGLDAAGDRSGAARGGS
jgi:uroporphyrinogen decarboxylase